MRRVVAERGEGGTVGKKPILLGSVPADEVRKVKEKRKCRHE